MSEYGKAIISKNDKTGLFRKNQDYNYIQVKEDKVKLDSINTEEILTKTEASTTYKTIASEWYGTQSQYDGIAEKDPNITYFIIEE